MSYTGGSHTVFHHRYHIVWITKYRYKVLEGALRERIRTIIRQLCKELGVQIVSGVLSREHVHMFVEIPPHIAVSDFVRRVKGRSSHQVQMEFPDLRKRYWGRHFWARGYFSTTSGNITDGDRPWPTVVALRSFIGTVRGRNHLWQTYEAGRGPTRVGIPPSGPSRLAFTASAISDSWRTVTAPKISLCAALCSSMKKRNALI